MKHIRVHNNGYSRNAKANSIIIVIGTTKSLKDIEHHEIHQTVTGLAIYKGEGYPGIVATAAEIAAGPTHLAKNTLIKQGNGVRLYRLTSGKLQMNRREDGTPAKEYSFIFTYEPK